MSKRVHEPQAAYGSDQGNVTSYRWVDIDSYCFLLRNGRPVAMVYHNHQINLLDFVAANHHAPQYLRGMRGYVVDFKIPDRSNITPADAVRVLFTDGLERAMGIHEVKRIVCRGRGKKNSNRVH